LLAIALSKAAQTKDASNIRTEAMSEGLEWTFKELAYCYLYSRGSGGRVVYNHGKVYGGNGATEKNDYRRGRDNK
jgi:hypothetical protein